MIINILLWFLFRLCCQCWRWLSLVSWEYLMMMMIVVKLLLFLLLLLIITLMWLLLIIKIKVKFLWLTMLLTKWVIYVVIVRKLVKIIDNSTTVIKHIIHIHSVAIRIKVLFLEGLCHGIFQGERRLWIV